MSGRTKAGTTSLARLATEPRYLSDGRGEPLDDAGTSDRLKVLIEAEGGAVSVSSDARRADHCRGIVTVQGGRKGWRVEHAEASQEEALAAALLDAWDTPR